MHHYPQSVAGKRNHVSSINPAYQMQRIYNTIGDRELDFWDASKTKTKTQTKRNEHYSDSGSSDDIEFQVQKHAEGIDSYSPPLWKANSKSRSISISKSRHTLYESSQSPLLPQNQYYSIISPTARTLAIEQGRKELMEMIRDKPESFFELSLKDMVDQQQHMHIIEDETVEKPVVEEMSLQYQAETKTKKSKKKCINSGKVSRRSSMDNNNNNYILKMCLPTFIGPSKQAANSRNLSKVSPRLSVEGSDKGWSMRRIFVSGESSDKGEYSRTTRYADDNPVPGCWPFFQSKKSKWKGYGG